MSDDLHDRIAEEDERRAAESRARIAEDERMAGVHAHFPPYFGENAVLHDEIAPPASVLMHGDPTKFSAGFATPAQQEKLVRGAEAWERLNPATKAQILGKDPPAPQKLHAYEILEAARKEQEDRARFYDAPAGERSMARIVATFNALTGMQLTELDGWWFMVALKMVRSRQGAFRADNFIDAASYAALAGEAAAKTTQEKNP